MNRLRISFVVCLIAISAAGCTHFRRGIKAECLTCSRPNPCRGKVVLIRGIVGYWPGISDFECCLRERGFDVQQTWGGAYIPGVVDELIAEGAHHRPIHIVGYSLGGNSALAACRELRDRGVRVSSLVMLDTPYKGEVPTNVNRTDNYYQPRRTDWIPAFRGVSMARESVCTSLNNHPLQGSVNHFEICADPKVHEMLADRLLASSAGNQAPTSMSAPTPLPVLDLSPAVEAEQQTGGSRKDTAIQPPPAIPAIPKLVSPLAN